MPGKPKPAAPDPRRERRRQLQRLRAKLESDGAAWSRWLTRLKRAFTAVVKLDRRLGRLRRQIAESSGP